MLSILSLWILSWSCFRHKHTWLADGRHSDSWGAASTQSRVSPGMPTLPKEMTGNVSVSSTVLNSKPQNA